MREQAWARATWLQQKDTLFIPILYPVFPLPHHISTRIFPWEQQISIWSAKCLTKDLLQNTEQYEEQQGVFLWFIHHLSAHDCDRCTYADK